MRHRTIVAISAVLLFHAVGVGQTNSNTSLPQLPPPKPAEVKPIDTGRLEKGTYINDFFGISFSIPQDWVVQDSAEKQAVLESGKELVEANADTRKKAAVEAAATRTTFLLSLSKYRLEQSSTTFNAHFGFVVERIPTAIIKTGADYFTAMLRTAQGGAMKFEPQGQVRSVKIGGASFSIMDAKLTSPRGVTAEKLYATVRGNYALLFSYSYSDESDAKTFEDIMSSIRFR